MMIVAVSIVVATMVVATVVVTMVTMAVLAAEDGRKEHPTQRDNVRQSTRRVVVSFWLRIRLLLFEVVGRIVLVLLWLGRRLRCVCLAGVLSRLNVVADKLCHNCRLLLLLHVVQRVLDGPLESFGLVHIVALDV